MAVRNSDFGRLPWSRAVLLAVVLVGATFGLTYFFVEGLFLGDPIPDLAPGNYDVVGYHQGEKEFLFWLQPKDTEAPAQYHVIPAQIVVVEESLSKSNQLEVIKERGWTRVNLYLDP